MRIATFIGIGALAIGVALPVLATTEAGPLLVTVTTSPNPYAIKGTTSVNNSSGILAISTGTKDSALQGYAEGAGSAGLEGYAESSSGAASNGVFGYAVNGYGTLSVAASNAYAGVAGSNTSTGSGATGVSGTAAGSTGVGVYGTTTGTGTTGYGVFGLDSSTNQNASGVGGSSKSGNGLAGSTVSGYAVFGQATSGIGVFAETGGLPPVMVPVAGLQAQDDTNAGAQAIYAASDNGYGIFGTNASTNEAAIYGLGQYFDGIAGVTSDDNSVGMLVGVHGSDESDTSGVTNDVGVLGDSSWGQGVYGLSREHQGVYGQSDVDTGVAGISGSATGVVAESMYGTGLSVYQYEGTGNSNHAVDPALYIQSNNSDDLIVAHNGSSTNKDVMTLDTSGNMVLDGGLTENGAPQSTVRDASGAQRIAYSQRATQATIEDFGHAELSAGAASVRLDPVFASTLDGAGYMVFFTPEGPAGTLYVANRTLGGFEIHETGGHSTLGVEYRIVGHPRAERAEARLAYFAQPSTDRSTAARVAADIRHIAQTHRMHQPRRPVTLTRPKSSHRTFAIPPPPRTPLVPQIGWRPTH